jgi:selenocysteine lyase/cysteine desulfurase
MNDLATKLDGTVKVVSLTMVSNVTGEITDFAKVHSILDTQDARPLLLLDASQAVPHFKVDVTET